MIITKSEMSRVYGAVLSFAITVLLVTAFYLVPAKAEQQKKEFDNSL